MQSAEAPAHLTAGEALTRRVHWFTLLLLGGAGAAVRFKCLICKPFWFDECFSVEVARLGWKNFLHLLWWREANMALYYLLLRGWLHLGHSEYFIRSLSVVIEIATIPAIYWLARVLYERRVALIATALYVVNGYSVRYAQEARSYALFLLLATLSSVFLVRVLRNSNRANWSGYVIFTVLAIYAHFYALLLVVAHWLAAHRVSAYVQSSDGAGDCVTSLRRAWLTIGAASLPVLIFVAKTGAGPIRWIPRPGLRDLLTFFEHLAGSTHWFLPGLYAVAVLAAILPFRTKLTAQIQDWQLWRTQFLLIGLLFPVGLAFVLSFARPVFLGRYMIFCLPPLLILVAAGLARLRHPALLGIAVAAILLLSLRGVFFVYAHDFDTERDASSIASSFVLDHAQTGDAVVFHIAETRIPYEFFRSERVRTASSSFTGQLGPEIVFPRHGAVLDYRDFTGKPTPELLRSLAAHHPRVWVMLMNNGTPGNPDPTTVMLTQVMLESFPQMQHWQFPRVEVRLYSK